MENVIYEIVKEFIMPVAGLNYNIKGRILKRKKGDDSLNVDFQWEVSHYYKPSEEASGVYIPSSKFGNTYDIVEVHLLAYMYGFKDIDIQLNKNY